MPRKRSQGRTIVTPAQVAERAARTLQGAPGAAVPLYLIASYLYYQHDISMFPDEFFDRMCHTMLKTWDTLEHPHKPWINRESLEAGTGFDLPFERLPTVCRSAAMGVALEMGFELPRGCGLVGEPRGYTSEGWGIPPEAP